MGYKIVAALAFVGFLASLAVHVLAWFGITPPGGQLVFLLHLVIFLFWIPLVILSSRTKPADAGKNNLNHLYAELPKWARTAFKFFVAYLVVNFLYFLYCTSKYPKNGVPPWVELRGFSGHWMLFYGAAAAGFFGLYRLKREQKNQPF